MQIGKQIQILETNEIGTIDIVMKDMIGVQFERMHRWYYKTELTLVFRLY